MQSDSIGVNGVNNNRWVPTTAGVQQPTNLTNNRVNTVAGNVFTVIVFVWKDSFLCLIERYVSDFILPAAGAAAPTPTTAGVPAPATVNPPGHVFWNNGQGICRLVPVSQLKGAFTSCRPLRIHAISLSNNIFDVMFQEIFKLANTNYTVVGGLDSETQGSNYLQWRIKEAHKQQIRRDVILQGAVILHALLRRPQQSQPQQQQTRDASLQTSIEATQTQAETETKKVQALIAKFEEIAQAQHEAPPRIEQAQPETKGVQSLIKKTNAFIEQTLMGSSAKAEVQSSQTPFRLGQVQTLIAQTEAQIKQAQAQAQAQDTETKDPSLQAQMQDKN
jgi:hypothetical protein